MFNSIKPWIVQCMRRTVFPINVFNSFQLIVKLKHEHDPGGPLFNAKINYFLAKEKKKSLIFGASV